MKKIIAKKVLHLTTHLGGGVGGAILGYISKVQENPTFTHTVACLNYVDERSAKRAAVLGLELFDMMHTKRPTLLKMIAKSDVVLIHWWNHPLLYDFLVRERLPKSRVIIWSHVSGLEAPNVFTKKILQYPDMFIFTTPISLKAPGVKKYLSTLRVIWSTRGVEYLASLRPKMHHGFNVGYIGTLDYAKLRRDFLALCSKINIPGVHFIICGDDNGGKLKAEAEKMGIGRKFNFVGWVPDVAPYLAIFDLLGYPLSPTHYGTCDHVLQESMAAGVVPIVFGNKMERSMVRDGVTGIVVKNGSDYIRAVRMLYKNTKLRERLSKNARQYALHHFSIDKMVNEWDRVLKEALTMTKTPKKWPIQKNISSKEVFLESLGEHGQVFCDYCNAQSQEGKLKALQKIAALGQLVNWSAETKGTVHNYNTFLPRDRYLSLWSGVMRGNSQSLKNL